MEMSWIIMTVSQRLLENCLLDVYLQAIQPKLCYLEFLFLNPVYSGIYVLYVPISVVICT